MSRTTRTLTLLGLLASAPLAADPPAGLTDAISPAHAYEWCRVLADPETAGRLTGHPGYTRAAEWAAERMREWGLQPLFPDGSFLQPYPSPYTLVEEAEVALVLPAEDGAERVVPLQAGKDFLPLLFTDAGQGEYGVTFVGWGISAPELGYDDYAGVEVAGRFVLCFRGTPPDPDGRFIDHDHHRARLSLARARGARGLIYIYDKVQANPNGDWQAGFLGLMIAESAADHLLAAREWKAPQVRADLTRYGRPLSQPLPGQVRVRLRATHYPDGVGYNVGGFLPGTDPTAGVVVLGGHLDHCGVHLGVIYPGANDNASGCASVLEAARALAGQPDRPTRAMAFVLFGGEEMGLLGSTYFVATGPTAAGPTRGMINLDMSGQGDGLWCGYSLHDETPRLALEAAQAELGLLTGSRAIRRVGVRGSDFAPFFAAGVPCLTCGSNGPHVFYHEPRDTIHRINPHMLADAARFILRAGWHLANP